MLRVHMKVGTDPPEDVVHPTTQRPYHRRFRPRQNLVENDLLLADVYETMPRSKRATQPRTTHSKQDNDNIVANCTPGADRPIMNTPKRKVFCNCA